MKKFCRVQRKKVYRPDLYQKAAEDLIVEKLANKEDFPVFASETGFRQPQTEFIDNVIFDGHKPNAYIESFSIGLKGKVELK